MYVTLDISPCSCRIFTTTIILYTYEGEKFRANLYARGTAKSRENPVITGESYIIYYDNEEAQMVKIQTFHYIHDGYEAAEIWEITTH